MIPKNVRYKLGRLRGNVLQNFNRLRSVEAIFTSIYNNHRWGDDESVSGTGSKIEQTKGIAAFMPQLFRKYNIRSVLDIPCGDFNWMQHVDLSTVNYLGADIVPGLISKNTRSYAAPHVNFFVADIIKDELPKVDLVFCRDCFVHFSDNHISAAIENIKNSGAEFILTTTFPHHSNFDIVTGNWRALNLQSEPFCLPQPLELFIEGFHPEKTGISDKSLALWRVSDLP